MAGGLVAERASAAEVLMKDGRVLKGMLGEVSGLADVPAILDTNGDTGRMRSIVFLDDSLTRTFVPQRQIQEVHPDAAGQVLEKFRINQRAAHSGSMVRTVGPITKIEPFDEYGRRTITMATVRGDVQIIQGITEITPEWTKVEGIKLEKMPCVWDMRIATSSIPSETLHKILIRQTGKNSVEQRKKLAKFFLQCERFREAGAELKAILDDFPDDTELQGAIGPVDQGHPSAHRQEPGPRVETPPRRRPARVGADDVEKVSPRRRGGRNPAGSQGNDPRL